MLSDEELTRYARQIVLPHLGGPGQQRLKAAKVAVVGAGGIGLQIAERIRVRHWDEVAFIILLMVVTVAAMDWLSARLRRRLIGTTSGG